MKEQEKNMQTAGELLVKLRSQALVTARLREKTKETTQGLRSLRLDGMPRAAGGISGLDAGMIRQEETARMLRREEARMRRMEKAAREWMGTMRPELYAFCAMYYICGLSLTETAEAIDRSVRQCMRYRKEIEEAVI